MEMKECDGVWEGFWAQILDFGLCFWIIEVLRDSIRVDYEKWIFENKRKDAQSQK